MLVGYRLKGCPSICRTKNSFKKAEVFVVGSGGWKKAEVVVVGFRRWTWEQPISLTFIQLGEGTKDRIHSPCNLLQEWDDGWYPVQLTPEFTQVFETTVEKEHLSEYGWLTGKSDSKHQNIWIVNEEALRAPQQNQVRSKVLTHYSGNEGQRQISQLTNHHSSKKTSLSSTSQKNHTWRWSRSSEWHEQGYYPPVQK